MLTEEQQKWAIKQVERWLSHCPYAVTADHVMASGLLPRLLSGKDPLDKAPPFVGGRHCYELYEEKTVALGSGPRQIPKNSVLGEKWDLVIDDRVDYSWVNEDDGIVMHRNGDSFKVWYGEYQASTVFGGETYLEDRWQIKLHQKTAPVVAKKMATRAANGMRVGVPDWGNIQVRRDRDGQAVWALPNPRPVEVRAGDVFEPQRVFHMEVNPVPPPEAFEEEGDA